MQWTAALRASLWVFVVLVGVCLCAGDTRVQTNMKVQYEWRTLDFEWPNANVRAKALRSGAYNPSLNYPFSLEVAGDRIFLTTGSFGLGCPITLATVPKESQSKSPLLKPYPSWDAHFFGQPGRVDCSRTLINVVRARADSCGRLWVADAGRYAFVNTILLPPVCPPKLVVFDLKSDKPIRTYIFPREQISWLTVFISTEVDTADGCEDAFAYMTDSVNYRAHVYSWRNNTSWTVRHPAFLPQLNAVIFRVGRVSIPLPDGVYDFTVPPAGAPTPITGKGSVFWHDLGSFTQNWVSRRALQDPTLSQDTSQYKKVGDRSPAQGQQVLTAIDSRGVMFSSLANHDGVGCWNTTRPYNPDNVAVVSRGEPGLMYPAGIRVEVREGGDDEVWLLSSARLRTILSPVFRVDTSQINARIYRESAKKLTSGTVCGAG